MDRIATYRQYPIAGRDPPGETYNSFRSIAAMRPGHPASATFIGMK